MISTTAFFARLVGVLAVAVATLAVAVSVLGLAPAQATKSETPAASTQVAAVPDDSH